MLRPDVKQIALAGWVAIDVALAVVIGQEMGWSLQPQVDVPRPVTLAPDHVSVKLPRIFELASLEKDFAETTARPLFVPTRRPPPPPPPPPKPTMTKGQFQLVGVMMLPEASYAILKEVSSGVTKKVEKGQAINGILLKSVEPERVVLTQYDDVETLTMKVQPSPKKAPAAAAATPAKAGGAAAAKAAREAKEAAKAARAEQREERANRQNRVPPVMNIPGLRQGASYPQVGVVRPQTPAARAVPQGNEPAKATRFEP